MAQFEKRALCAMLTLGLGCGDGSSTTGAMDDAASDAETDVDDAVVDAAADDPLDTAADAQVDASSLSMGPPPEATQSAADWPLINHDYQGTRATFSSKIDATNAATLKQAWFFELPAGGSFGAATAEALVVGDTVYYQDMQSNVFAIDRLTGKKRWSHDYNRATSGPNGLAVAWGRVYATSSDHEFVALDADDGKQLWKAPITVGDNGGISIAPQVYDGLVYLSTVPVTATGGYLGGITGTLYALKYDSGDVVWQFETIDSDDRWGDPDVNSGGGAWYAPTIDIEGPLMYWGTGNPGPYPGTRDAPNASSRPGDDLYTCSVVAVNAGSGELEWYFQERPHDLFDLDFQNSPIIVNATIQGKERKAVIGSGKTGTVVALDADTGALLWRAEVGKHQNDDLTEIPDGGAEVYPGDLGGIETPCAYAEGSVFVAVVNWSRFYTPSASGAQGTDASGELYALDVSDGSVRWKQALDGGPSFGAATIVNDVVFTSSYDGTVYGFNRNTGEELFRFSASLGINAPITAAHDMLFIPAGTGLGVPGLIALELGD